MEEYRAIPQGYMTVGDVAKKMNVSVRTLQYYDREGLFIPSGVSEGGRRLYTDQDIINLHQILALKSLGFSLKEIKSKLIYVDTPDKAIQALSEQAEAIREKIEVLKGSLQAIERLKAEAEKMQTVDFKKYADIIVNLQMNNKYYGLIRHFDESMSDYCHKRFDKESGNTFIEKFNKIIGRAETALADGVTPESEKGQEIARAFWNTVTEFTNGDADRLTKLMNLRQMQANGGEDPDLQEVFGRFLEPALGKYLKEAGIDPFGGEHE